MAIKMNTYAGNQIAPEYDGMLYDMIFGQSGVISGCELSFMGANQVHIGKGYILIKGRFCTVLEETLLVEMSGSESELPGRIYIHADLTDSQEPVKFMSVTGNPLPELNQDEDFNYNDGIYEIELGTYTAGSTSISNLVTTFEEIDGTGGIKKLIGNLSNLKTESKDTIVSAINEQNVNITSLTKQITSFENTKSDIVGSALGKALGMSTSSKWADIVADIEGVPDNGAWSGSIKSLGGSVGIPKGYHNGEGSVSVPLAMQTLTIEQNLTPPYTYTYQIPLDGTYVFIFAGPVQFADTSGNYKTTISYGSTELEYQSQYAYALNGLYGGVCVVTKPQVCKAGVNILLRHTGLAASGSPAGNARFIAVRVA